MTMTQSRQTSPRNRRCGFDRLAPLRPAPAGRLLGPHPRQPRTTDPPQRQTTLDTPRAEFLEADIRDREAVRSALEGVDVVFHQAAYGGYMPEMAKYVHVNSFGTAQMLEIIRDENLPVEKVVVASSQAVYREGAATCPSTASSSRTPARAEQLAAGDFAVRCPRLRRVLRRRSPRPKRPRSAARRSTPSPSSTRSGWS